MLPAPAMGSTRFNEEMTISLLSDLCQDNLAKKYSPYIVVILCEAENIIVQKHSNICADFVFLCSFYEIS